MFLTQAIKPKNEFWRYLLGSLTIIIAATVGQIPLFIAVGIKASVDSVAFPEEQNAMLGFLEPNLSLFLMLLSFVFALGGILLVVRHFHQQTLLEVVTARQKFDWKRLFFTFSVWAIFLIITTAIDFLVNPNDYQLNFKPFPFLILLLVGVLFMPIQTSVEELVFRGYLMQGFAVLSKNRWFPLLMTSIIFGSMHLMNPEVSKMGYIILIYYIGSGFLMGIMTLMDDGLELSMGFHAANNLIGALLVTSNWSVFQTHSILKEIAEPTVSYNVFLPIVVVFPILLLVLSKKYKWNNWQQKLTGKIDKISENTSKIE